MVNPIVNKLRNKGVKTVTIEDDGEKYSWIIKSISTVDLMDNEEIFDDLPEMNNLGDKEAQKVFRKKLMPMMKTFLPLCCVSPRVTLDPKDPELDKPETDLLLFKELPIGISSQLFKEILEASGLTKEAEEVRKKLQPTQS